MFGEVLEGRTVYGGWWASRRVVGSRSVVEFTAAAPDKGQYFEGSVHEKTDRPHRKPEPYIFPLCSKVLLESTSYRASDRVFRCSG